MDEVYEDRSFVDKYWMDLDKAQVAGEAAAADRRAALGIEEPDWVDDDPDDGEIADFDEPTSRAVAETAPLPTIAVSTDIRSMVDQALAALSIRDTNLFQRGGSLVSVVEGQPAPKGIIRAPSAPNISVLSAPTIRERLSANANWETQSQRGEGEGRRQHVLPPLPVTYALRDRGSWAGVRPLEGITGYPFQRLGGSMVTARGYDEATGVFVATDLKIKEQAGSATRTQARAAVDEVLDLVCDFPFETAAHKSAWLAGLLTPLVRFRVDGPVPVFVIVANIRGAGKTLLADLIGEILTGVPMTHTTNTSDDAEMRKKLTAFFVAGDPLVLFDNAEGLVGTPSLDNVITSRVFTERILGKTENTAPIPNRATFFVTGNNPILREDTARRSIEIRLESQEEHPERRGEFKYRLSEAVPRMRAQLVVDLLNILAAYEGAGRPTQALQSFGSFDAWSEAVRGPLVWLGLPDPVLTNVQAVDAASEELDLISDLVDGWEAIEEEVQRESGEWGQGKGLRVAEVRERLVSNYMSYGQLRDALHGLCGAGGALPNSRRIGLVLRGCQNRWLPSGKRIVQARRAANTAYWTVERRAQKSP